MSASKPEVWLRGPLPDVPPLLQPVAHAWLQAVEEVEALMMGFPADLLWKRPGGAASAGFHLQHLPGVLDRLLTYARGEALSDAQLKYLAAEGTPETTVDTTALVHTFRAGVNQALVQLRATDERTLTQHRSVGRGKLPSTTLGLLFHSAEHIQRHAGQLLVTVRVLRERART